MIGGNRPLGPVLLCLAMAASVPSLLGGCQKASSAADSVKVPTGHDKADDAKTPAASSAEDGDNGGGSANHDSPEGLHLKPAEVQKLGVKVAALKATTHAPESSGFGVVMAHEALAQALADLRTTAAVARQSGAARARAQRLAGTAGAMPLDTLETAERQATVDTAALELARQRLSSAFGQKAPWTGREEKNPLLDSLANGEAKLVRVTFPADALGEASPGMVRLGRIGTGQTSASWQSGTVWAAPADSAMPGRSFFVAFRGSGLNEGERLLASTPVGEPGDGVLVPASAAVITGGRYWCYIEVMPGSYVRTEFDPTVPVRGGYFVASGIEAGDKVVIEAAGQLLAKELNPSTEAE